MGKIILLNGPPSSGKDTAAKHIRNFYNLTKRPLAPGEHGSLPTKANSCLLDRMSMPVKRAFAGTMGLPITEDGIVEPWESRKEEVIPEFGISYRQWQIDFSESFLKKYKADIFGYLLADRIQRRFHKNIANLIIVPDCGFDIEITSIYREFAWEDILLIRCHRPGFTFTGDSRSNVRAPKGTAIFDASNMRGEDEYRMQIEIAVKTWLEEPERLPREE